MRARNVKPGFFKNDILAECDLLARILFAGLWCLADREGRLEYRPKKIKAEVLPYDNCNIEKLIGQLAERQFITTYDVDGVFYIQINAFQKHQNCHMREPESTIPAPVQHGASTVQAPGEHGSGPAESPLLNPESPLLNPEYTARAREAGQIVYDTWNQAGLIVHSDYNKFQSNIKAALKGHSADEIITAISNYKTVYHDDRYYWTHKWGLREFLQRGLDRFVPMNFNEKDYLKREENNGNGASKPRQPTGAFGKAKSDGEPYPVEEY